MKETRQYYKRNDLPFPTISMPPRKRIRREAVGYCLLDASLDQAKKQAALELIRIVEPNVTFYPPTSPSQSLLQKNPSPPMTSRWGLSWLCGRRRQK